MQTEGTMRHVAPPDATAPPRLLGRLRSMRYTLLSLSAVAIVFAAWWIEGAFGLIDPMLLPTLPSLGSEFAGLATEGYNGTPLWKQVLASFGRAAVGFLLAVAAGVPAGLIFGTSRAAAAVFRPFLGFFRPIPPIAMIPLFIFYFGLGEPSKILLIAITAFWYITLNTTAGVRAVPEDLVLAAKSLGLTRWQLFSRVILPAAMPHIFVGLRVGVALCWALVVAAELIAAQTGLGFMIMDATNFFRIPVVFIGIAIIGLVGLILELGLDLLERRMLHWQGR